MKRIILGLAVLGLVGCFLPLLPGLSLFDLRHFDEGWHVWLVVGAFALPAYVAACNTEGEKATALAGCAGFGYLAYKFGTGVFDLVIHASIGGILMGVAIIAGLAVSVAGTLRDA